MLACRPLPWSLFWPWPRFGPWPWVWPWPWYWPWPWFWSWPWFWPWPCRARLPRVAPELWLRSAVLPLLEGREGWVDEALANRGWFESAETLCCVFWGKTEWPFDWIKSEYTSQTNPCGTRYCKYYLTHLILVKLIPNFSPTSPSRPAVPSLFIALLLLPHLLHRFISSLLNLSTLVVIFISTDAYTTRCGECSG